MNSDSQSSSLRPGVNEKRSKPGEGCYTPEIRRLRPEIQLAYLLIRYDLLDEARIALNRAGEKVKSAKRRYQIGALLVQLNELKSATRHFGQILTMSEPERAMEKNTGLIGRAITPRFQITSSSGTNRLRRPQRDCAGNPIFKSKPGGQAVDTN